MNEPWVKLLAAALGTVGFCVFFYVHPRRLLPATLGGVISCAIYLLIDHYWGGILLPNIVAAAVAAIYAEICARVTRVPVTVYLFPGVISLAPGSSLYYTMVNLTQENYSTALFYGRTALQVSLGIAGGIAVGSMLGIFLRSLRRAEKNHSSSGAKTH